MEIVSFGILGRFGVFSGQLSSFKKENNVKWINLYQKEVLNEYWYILFWKRK